MVGPNTNLLHCRRNVALTLGVREMERSPIHFRWAKAIGHYGICCNCGRMSVQLNGRDNFARDASSKDMLVMRTSVNGKSREVQDIATLSRLVIRANCENSRPASQEDLNHLRHDLWYIAALATRERANFLMAANRHHVIVRALTALQNAASLEKEGQIGEWCEEALSSEHARIERAISHLHAICEALEAEGCEVAVIKSLDHWPDLGSDLDLFTSADQVRVDQIMRARFSAHPIERSWGDRLANKWNYRVPDLPELVEIHVQYLGQTGEHEEIARRVIGRRVSKAIGPRVFQTAAAEERIVISALQRVYRHFYFRLCDMVDMTELLQSGGVHYGELKRAASSAGIWPGIATFLCLIQNYVSSYGAVLDIPDDVKAAAHAPRAQVKYDGGFLRVAKATALSLYGSQLLQAGLRHDVRALVRLPLLPPLAVSALVAHSLTGNDKGIW